MATITAYGTVKDGKLFFANRRRFDSDLSKYKDCAVTVTIRKKNVRSSLQNRYYWGIVVKEIEIRMKELGNDVDDDIVHEFLKGRFNPVKVIGEGGEIIDEMPGSTTEMNKEEFAIYIDKIIEWAASFLQITIPLPNSDLQIQY